MPSVEPTTAVKWSKELCEKILLVTLINHPTLISVMAEQLTSVDWSLKGSKEFISALLNEPQSETSSFLSNELLQKHASFIKMLGMDEMVTLAPFSQKNADSGDAEQGFLSIFHSVFTKKQLEQTLADVKERLTKQFDEHTWQMFQQLKKELQSF
jgi:hypothetical protein